MTLTLMVVGIFFGVVAAVIAHQKGRSKLRWFLVGFFFHIIGLVVLFIPPVPKLGVTKKCPKCAEIIKAEARICRFCHQEITAVGGSEVSLA